MTNDCNRNVLEQARRNVADRFVQVYHINAILSGDWDKGELVTAELNKLLKGPPQAESEDG